jgi:hypothetical protein
LGGKKSNEKTVTKNFKKMKKRLAFPLGVWYYNGA